MAVRVWIAVLGLSLAAGCASTPKERAAPENPLTAKPAERDRMDEARRGVADAALTPLKDVGIVRPEIPEFLKNMQYPYETGTLAGACAQVAYEMGQLDAHLGQEIYRKGDRRPLSERALDQVQSAAVGLVRDAAVDAVPFRGWVRRISGADKAAKEAAAAFEAGQTRRAFLRGYGSALGCPGMLPSRNAPGGPAQSNPQRPER